MPICTKTVDADLACFIYCDTRLVRLTEYRVDDVLHIIRCLGQIERLISESKR